MSEFATYQQFFSEEEAQPVIELLKQYDIPFTFKPLKSKVDKIIVGEVFNASHDLRIPTDQFDRVTSLLLANTEVNIDELDKDHYLLVFTKEELYNILKNPDEWGRQDYILAVKLLRRQGENVTDEKLQELRERKMEVLAKPEKKISPFLLIMAYILPAFAAIRAWLPGINNYYDQDFVRVLGTTNLQMLMAAILAIIIGGSIWKFKKLLPNGNRVYSFQPGDRKHGKIILLLGFVAIISVLLSILYADNTGNHPHEIFN